MPATVNEGSTARWEDAYGEYLRELTLTRLRVAGPLVVFVFCLDGAAEFVFQREWFWNTFWIRLGVALLCLLISAISRWDGSRKLAFGLTVVFGIAVGADVEAVILQSGGFASPFTTGFGFVIIAAGLFFPYSPLQMMLVSALLWTVYAVPLLFLSAPVAHTAAWAEIFFLACATVIALTASRFTADLRRREFMAQQRLAEEEEKTERLLLNILPRAIADRLKNEEKQIADAFSDVSILFADIVGFTPLSARLPPQKVVAFLNSVFSEFDHLTDARGLEKIKTVGDTYMAIGGLAHPRPDHLEAIAELALDMLDAVRRITPLNGYHLEIRIGINTGPVVAGVIGEKKFAYDLWGDTVNTASRMESTGGPGRIQVTCDVYERLRERYVFEERGPLQIKGKGEITTYFLKRRKAQASST